MGARASDLADPGFTSSHHDVRFTRRNTEKFQAKKRCVICNKQWLRGKEPISMVSTKNSQKAIEEKAKKLGRDDILLRLIGQGHDMVANDIAYHKPCMNNFKAQRIHSGKRRLNLYAVAFTRLVEELEAPLFHDLSGFFLKSVRNPYREILRELGVKNADEYRTISMKLKLQQLFGSRVSVLNQTCGSGFMCASGVPLGDALEKLRRLEADHMQDEKHHALRQAAKILRADCVNCMRQTHKKHSTEVSFASANNMVPDLLFNFTAMLLNDKIPELSPEGRVIVDQPTAEKAILMSQHILQHVSRVATPLGIATAYYIQSDT